MEEMPRIEPCEKSSPPIVMMKKTPIAAIITTYTWFRSRIRFFGAIILPFVRKMNRMKMTTSPTTGRYVRI